MNSIPSLRRARALPPEPAKARGPMMPPKAANPRPLPIGILVYRLNTWSTQPRLLDWTATPRWIHWPRRRLDSLFIETKDSPADAVPPVETQQDAQHHHRQRQAEAGRRSPVQRGLNKRKRAGADDQHPAGQ